jgi:cobalt-zinc-cadmium efflux system membrane fusion protein
MNSPQAAVPRRPRYRYWILGLAVLGGLAWWMESRRLQSAPANSASAAPQPQLAKGSDHTLIVPEETVHAMALSSETARTADESQHLKLTGQLMLDPGRLVHINARFPGEVVQIGSRNPKGEQPEQLRSGDRVVKGQRLAVVWSKEIGEKKSDLVDALSQLEFHKKLYLSLKSLQKDGGVSQRAAEEAKRNYESDLIQVERVRRTLRSWRIDEQELVEVEGEFQRIQQSAAASPEEMNEITPIDAKVSASWAEIDIRSPLDGVILEKNVTVGDIVSTESDLFQVADLSQLMVMANVYEEDLAKLNALPPDQRTWSVRLLSTPSAPPHEGRIETIGNVIDPNQHTAVAQGWMNNEQGDLRVGQFVEATVQVPMSHELVEIPSSALIDDGARKFVLIALDESLCRLQRREVHVVHRNATSIILRPTEALGVRPGERVLTGGVMELLSVLNDLAPLPSAAPTSDSKTK